MGLLEDDVDKKQEEKYKHQVGAGQDRVYLLKVVLDEGNLFDYMDKDVVFKIFHVINVTLLTRATEILFTLCYLPISC